MELKDMSSLLGQASSCSGSWFDSELCCCCWRSSCWASAKLVYTLLSSWAKNSGTAAAGSWKSVSTCFCVTVEHFSSVVLPCVGTTELWSAKQMSLVHGSASWIFDDFPFVVFNSLVWANFVTWRWVSAGPASFTSPITACWSQDDLWSCGLRFCPSWASCSLRSGSWRGLAPGRGIRMMVPGTTVGANVLFLVCYAKFKHNDKQKVFSDLKN